MDFTVTAEHVAKGVRGCRRCPIALAIKDKLPGHQVTVTTSEVYIRKNFPDEKFSLPDRIRRFIIKFDAGKYTHNEDITFSLPVEEKFDIT